MVLELADLPRLELAQPKVQQDGLLHPGVDDPFGAGLLGQANLAEVEPIDDALDGQLCLGAFELTRVGECGLDQCPEIGSDGAQNEILSQTAMACSISGKLGTSASRT